MHKFSRRSDQKQTSSSKKWSEKNRKLSAPVQEDEDDDTDENMEYPESPPTKKKYSSPFCLIVGKNLCYSKCLAILNCFTT